MRIALFVTCLAEAFAPEVADAAAQLIADVAEDFEVVLVGDACCGQPAWNAGYPAEARTLARRLIPRLLEYDRVIVPSGSCATMLLRYYPHLFPEGDAMASQAAALAARTTELAAYLAEHLPRDADATEGSFHQDAVEAPRSIEAIAFHPSCHSLRGACVGDAGERCMEAHGYHLKRQADVEECCGFGGMFAVKESALSTTMADHKLDAMISAGVETIVSGELGCLLHLEGRARRRGMLLRFRHLALALAEKGRASVD